jgi:rhodanese-related sulfurtransferase
MKQIGNMFLIFILCIIISLFVFYDPYKLSVHQFNEKIKKNQYDYLLDVRTPEEWKQGHHEKAILMPIGTFVTELPNVIKNKNSKILIYCKKGIRAEASAKIANRLGYRNVYWMNGTWDDLRVKN